MTVKEDGADAATPLIMTVPLLPSILQNSGAVLTVVDEVRMPCSPPGYIRMIVDDLSTPPIRCCEAMTFGLAPPSFSFVSRPMIPQVRL